MESAILYARKGVKQGPTDSGQHYMLCLALHMGEEFKEAIDACDNALALMPYRPVNYVVQLAWSQWEINNMTSQYHYSRRYLIAALNPFSLI